METTSGKPTDLFATTVQASRLSDEDMQAMWAVFADYYRRSDFERFVLDLHEKSHVIVLRHKRDNTIKGFSTLQCYRQSVGARMVHIIYSGDTIVAREFWGQTALQRAFVWYICKYKLARPRVPVFWFLTSKGYKTYLLLSRNFPEYWPRHDKRTPELPRSIIHQFATQKFGKQWHPDLGLLRHTENSGRLAHHVAPITEEMRRKYPDIDFFARQNPNHETGDELCCIGLVNPAMWLNFLKRLLAKRLRHVGATPRALKEAEDTYA
jgi:hypothetical protein